MMEESENKLIIIDIYKDWVSSAHLVDVMMFSPESVGEAARPASNPATAFADSRSGHGFFDV